MFSDFAIIYICTCRCGCVFYFVLSFEIVDVDKRWCHIYYSIKISSINSTSGLHNTIHFLSVMQHSCAASLYSYCGSQWGVLQP